VGALIVAMLPKRETKLALGLGVGIGFLEFLVSIPLATEFDVRSGAMQFVTNVPWIESFGVNYHVGVDGFSLWIILLTTLLTPICIWGSWNSIQHRGREFVASMLLLETGMLGALVALDLVLFFTFWEMMLVPMYLIIGIWGSEQRVAAAIKFFIFTMVGSALMLAAIIYLAVEHYNVTGGVWSFDLEALGQVVLPVWAQHLCFWAFVASFAIKIPLFPVHTWLPDAHTQAPTAGSVILAGVLLKMGVYGMLRFAMPLFPFAAAEGAQTLAFLSLVGIIYGALVAYAQSDVKRLVAYSSVSHMGFIVLGIAGMSTQGLTGATYQSLAHGLTTGALFMAVGVVYERRHTRQMSEFGGLAKVMPWFTAFFMIAMLGSAGLPGLVGFVGEFLILLGTFTHGALTLNQPEILVLIAALGVILGAVYLLWLFQRMMFGPITNPKNENLPDLGLREKLVFAPVIGLIILMGVYPKPFLDRIDLTAQETVSQFNFKRCASIRRVDSDEPALLAELTKECKDPIKVIRDAYGDERRSPTAVDGQHRPVAKEKPAADDKAKGVPKGKEGKEARPEGKEGKERKEGKAPRPEVKEGQK
jgi:NADH-quinone oxidoreductase subunit M